MKLIISSRLASNSGQSFCLCLLTTLLTLLAFPFFVEFLSLDGCDGVMHQGWCVDIGMGAYVHVCEYTCSCLWVCKYRSQRPAISVALHLIFKARSLTEPGAQWQTRLAVQQDRGILLSLFSLCLDYRRTLLPGLFIWVLDIRFQSSWLQCKYLPKWAVSPPLSLLVSMTSLSTDSLLK